METEERTQPQFQIVRRRRYGSWLILVVGVVLITALIWSLAANSRFGWPAVVSYLFHPMILRGVGTTLQLTAIVLGLATVIGASIALMRLSSSGMLRSTAKGYVWLFRGVPALIQLILWYNIALVVPGVSLELPVVGTVFSADTNDLVSPYAAAIIALSLCQGAYLAEIIRAGMLSVPAGQLEAARSLGMTPSRVLWQIVMPQSMRFIIPPTGNEAISLLKMTSLVTYVAVDDLFYAAQSIYARTFETIPLLIVVALWYLAIVTIMSVGQGYLERYYGRADAPFSTQPIPRNKRNLLGLRNGAGR